MAQLINSKVAAAVNSNKVQDNILSIVAISEQFKESESMAWLANPFEINFGTSTLLQEKFEIVMKNVGTVKPVQAGDTSGLRIIKPKPVKMDSEKDERSLPGSLDFGFPDTSSIDNSFNSRGEALSTAKLVFKLKNDVLKKENSKNKTFEKDLSVDKLYPARQFNPCFEDFHEKL